MLRHNPDLENNAQHCRDVAARPDASKAQQDHFSGLARFYKSLAESGSEQLEPTELSDVKSEINRLQG
jgi:hypothetical protein